MLNEGGQCLHLVNNFDSSILTLLFVSMCAHICAGVNLVVCVYTCMDTCVEVRDLCLVSSLKFSQLYVLK